MKRPLHITKIRHNREKPGLAAQHLTGLELVTQLHQGRLFGGEIRSSEVHFKGASFKEGVKEYTADVKTAGAIALLIQVSLPTLLYAPHPLELTLIGGTNAIMAPQIDYMISVFHPLVSRMGMKFELKIEKRGFYPRGGGVVHLLANPLGGATLNPINLTERGEISAIHIRSFVTAPVIAPSVGERMNKQGKHRMRQYVGKITQKTEVKFTEEIVVCSEQTHDAVGVGTGIIITVTTTTGCIFGGSALGERRKTAETVADEACDELISDLSSCKGQACVDQWTQDQLIIYMALAKGKSVIKCGKLTLHTKTAIHFTQLLTGAKFNVAAHELKVTAEAEEKEDKMDEDEEEEEEEKTQQKK